MTYNFFTPNLSIRSSHFLRKQSSQSKFLNTFHKSSKRKAKKSSKRIDF